MNHYQLSINCTDIVKDEIVYLLINRSSPSVKTRAMLEVAERRAARQRQEDLECQRKFKATPTPAHILLPLFDEIVTSQVILFYCMLFLLLPIMRSVILFVYLLTSYLPMLFKKHMLTNPIDF